MLRTPLFYHAGCVKLLLVTLFIMSRCLSLTVTRFQTQMQICAPAAGSLGTYRILRYEGYIGDVQTKHALTHYADTELNKVGSNEK